MPRVWVPSRAAARSPARRPPGALARRSIPRATAPHPSQTSGAKATAMRVLRALRPSLPARPSLRSLEMAGVVDSRDHEPTVAFLDDGDGSVLDPEREEAMVRASDHAMQRHLDDTAVRDHHHISGVMAGDDRVQLGRDARFKSGRALTAGNDVPARLLGPSAPRLGEALRKLFGGEPLPLDEVDLAQVGGCRRQRADRVLD